MVRAAVGWLVFNQLPDGLTALGIAIICASGMGIAYVEHHHHRAPPIAVTETSAWQG